MSRTTPRARLAVAGLGVFLVGAAALAHHQTAALRARFPVEDDLVYLPRTSVMRALSIGHSEAMADAVFLRTMIYYSDQFFGTRKFDWLARHVDAVNDLDPWFRTPYLFGSRAAMYNGKAITNEDVWLSNHFLERGLEHFPYDWELAFALGCNYLIELHPDNDKQRREWRRVAVGWIRRAALSGGGPAWLANLAATIMSEEGQTELAIRYLEEAYLNAADDKARDEIGRLLGAKRKSDVGKLTAARDAFMSGWQKQLPYAPADLYAIVGDPPSHVVDWRRLTANRLLDEPLE